MAFDGRYAAEAVGAMPGWDPERANARVEEQRARQLRDHFGLQRDEDLAYAFESFEDAVRAGGQALAVHRTKGVTLTGGAFEPGNVIRRAEALKDTFVELGVMRPHAVMNERTQKEWERALMRLAEEKTTHSEPSTILNAVKTWVELRTFMKARDRTVVEAVDLAAFIQDGTPGPSRALNALRWLSKAGSLQFNLTNIVLPTPKSNRQRKKQQAIVVEPPMLPFLEQAIAQCWEQSNPKWSALLSSWLIAVGVMRHQHLLRSEPVRLSRSTLHLWCEKGKQSSKRAAFHGRSQHTSPTALVGLQQCAGEAGGYPLASVSLAASSSALMVSDGHFLNANDAAKSCLKDMRKTPRISLRTPGAGWGRPLARSEGWVHWSSMHWETGRTVRRSRTRRLCQCITVEARKPLR